MGRNFGQGIVTSQRGRLLDAQIAGVAARQHGNITYAQLIAVGLSAAGVHYRVKVGRLFHVYRTVYAVGHPPSTPLQWASAAVLACGRGAALSHASAMVLWEFWRRWEFPLEVSVGRDRRPRGITVHRSSTLSWRDVATHRGVRVTRPARTLLDIAPRLDEKGLKRIVSRALHSPWLTESQLTELLARHPTMRSAARIAEMIGLPGTPSRSEWEDQFPDWCARNGLPQPIMGASVCGLAVDALFPLEKVIVELDSWEFHKDRIAFETDRDRDATTAAAGYLTIRITWQRAQAAEREATRLQEILRGRRGR